MNPRLALLAFLIVRYASAAAPTNTDALQLAAKILGIFQAKCAACHGSHLKTPEGKFGYVLDLKQLADNHEYVVSGKPEKSYLYVVVKNEEMPPDDDPKSLPLTDDEKAQVKQWVLAGAPHELPANLPAVVAPTPKTEAAPARPATSPKEQTQHTRVTLDFNSAPANEIFSRIGTLTGIPIHYVQPLHEPQLSIRLKDGTAFEALEYLALCGNLVLTFKGDGVHLDPNGPASPPNEPLHK